YLVRADRRADAAAADRHAAVDRPRRHSTGERDDEVRIIVVWIQVRRPEIDDLMSRLAKPGHQLLLQTKSTMIRGNSHAHVILLACIQQSVVQLLPGLRAAEPARGSPVRRESTHRRSGDGGAFLPFRPPSQPKGSGGRD